MANSTRKRILDNLKTTIAAISTGGGYNLTAGEVMRGLKAPTGKEEVKTRVKAAPRRAVALASVPASPLDMRPSS